MKIDHPISMKIVLLFILVASISTSCIPMIMHGNMKKGMMHDLSDKVQTVNMGQIVDEMIAEAVLNLSSKNLDVSSIAVWGIKTQTAGLDMELIHRKLISKLVDSGRFKVLTRERLEEILEEQKLSLSGVIDEQSAVEIGQLVGVEGFIDGYASIEGKQLLLNLFLVETKSGIITWTTTIRRNLQ